MNVLRLASLIFLSTLLMACASTLTLSPNRGLLEEEIPNLPPAKPISLRATVKVDAPELATGQKPGRTGDPSFNLEYPARDMLEQAAQVAVSRWFQKDDQDRGSARLEVRLQKLTWDEYTDVFMWRPVVQVEVELKAVSDSRIFSQQIFSSGKQKGDWLRKFWGPINNDFSPQYTRMIYRAMLIAIDKAMADVAQRLTGPAAPSLLPTQHNIPASAPQ